MPIVIYGIRVRQEDDLERQIEYVRSYMVAKKGILLEYYQILGVLQIIITVVYSR